MRAAVTTDSHHTRVIEREAPVPHSGQLRLRVEASGICGSDLHVLDAFGPGLTMGHEFVGIVDAVGDGVGGFATGDRVVALPVIACKNCRFCLSGDPINCARADYLGGEGQPGSFAEQVIVDAQASVRIPEGLSVELAAVVEPLSIGLKVFERSEAKPGDKILIMGGGPIGLAVALWARAGGAGTIVVSDPVASRRELALTMGATHVVDPLRDDVRGYFDSEWGAAPDIVIECAGRPGTFAQATDVVAHSGKVVIAGMHMGTEEFARLTPFLKNLSVQFCCWYTVRHYTHTVHMLATGRIDPSPMVTHRISLDELDDTLQKLKTPNEFGKVLILNTP